MTAGAYVSRGHDRNPSETLYSVKDEASVLIRHLAVTKQIKGCKPIIDVWRCGGDEL